METKKRDVNDNPNRHETLTRVDAKKNAGRNDPRPGNETKLEKSTEQQLLHHSIPKVIFNEQQPFLSEVSTRSALDNGYESTSGVLPLPTKSFNSSDPKGGRWKIVKKSVETKDLFITHIAESEDGGGRAASGSSKKWSDLIHIQYEFTPHECLNVFVGLLAIGALAFSFIFEEWSILDSLYFTTVLLTTVGYGDITPISIGGKLFASMFALVGIVYLGLVLGVLGSQLVEAEIDQLENMKSVASRALETTFALPGGSRRRTHVEKERIEHYIQTGERGLLRTDSASSLGSSASSSTCSDSVRDPESLLQDQLPVTKPGHNISDKNVQSLKERFSRIAAIRRHFPGILSIVASVGILALLEKWTWYDSIYYAVVTATTIGFGDITPSSSSGKVCAILFVPIVVGAMGYILGNVASVIVNKRRDKMSKNLWSKELKIEDLEALDEEGDGAVSELEYIKFMLIAMNKVDGALIDGLQKQFRQLDMTGDNQITKTDLKIMATRKMKKVTHKLKLQQYKMELLKKKPMRLGTVVAKLNMFNVNQME